MPRTQKSFYADDDILKFLDGQNHGDQSKLINEAIRLLIGSPSFEKRVEKQFAALRREIAALRGR